MTTCTSFRTKINFRIPFQVSLYLEKRKQHSSLWDSLLGYNTQWLWTFYLVQGTYKLFQVGEVCLFSIHLRQSTVSTQPGPWWPWSSMDIASYCLGLTPAAAGGSAVTIPLYCSSLHCDIRILVWFWAGVGLCAEWTPPKPFVLVFFISIKFIYIILHNANYFIVVYLCLHIWRLQTLLCDIDWLKAAIFKSLIPAMQLPWL